MNPTEEIERIATFIRNQSPSGVVIGISGGIDSAVVSSLAVRALGKELVYGIIMPMDGQDMRDAVAHAKSLGIHYKIINISPIFYTFKTTCNEIYNNDVCIVDGNLVEGNLQSRIRMCILYAAANKLNSQVIGTTNLSEAAIGYFTKYGDGGVDFEPIIHVLKCEVRELAEELNVSESIRNKPPSAGLGISKTDEEELGFTYDDLDEFLLEGSSGNGEIDAKINNLADKTTHKTKRPPELKGVPL